MKSTPFALTLSVLTLTLGATPVFADIKDYKFELVDAAVKAANGTEFTVRLINMLTGKPVPDAVIFATRLDMAPDNMADMTTRIAALPANEPGLYRFNADFTMAGQWRLSLSVKIQGETGTLVDTLVFKAQP